MNAAMCGHAGLVGVLIDADPSMEHLRMRDNGGKTAVDRAVENGRDECVALLKAAEEAAEVAAVAAASGVGGVGGVGGAVYDGGVVYDGPADALYEMCCSWSPLDEESMATVMGLIHTGIDVRYQVQGLYKCTPYSLCLDPTHTP